MSGRVTDDGLSEVIGFILIIAIIVILGSLYMTYVVPSQGRDAEIQHMQEIENFFTGFKMNMDSLWLNDQVGVSFNEILQLGTGGQTSAGAFSIFPIMQPVSSSGTVEIIEYPKLSFEIIGDFKSYSSNDYSSVNLSETQITNKDTPLYVNYHTNIIPWELPPYSPYSLNIWSIQNEPWSITLEVKNITLRPEDLLEVMEWNVNPETQAVHNLRISSVPTVEVVLSAEKNGVKILDNLVVSRQSIRNQTWNETQKIDLLDEAYGLHDDINFPFGVNYQYYQADGIKKDGLPNPFLLQVRPSTTVNSDEINAGSLKYSSRNPYWINQEYIYKMGKIFLKQGNIIEPKIDYPWFKVKNTSGIDGGAGYILSVDMTPLTIQGEGSVSGPDTVQLTAQITGIQDNVIQSTGNVYTPAETNPNAKELMIRIRDSSPSEAEYWNRTFRSILELTHQNEIGREWWKVNDPVPTDLNDTVIQIIGESGTTGRDINDIYVNYKQVNTRMSIAAPVYV